MHSYGQTGAADGIFVYLYPAVGILFLLALFSWKKKKYVI
jgi:hypothetical protein